MRLVMTLLVRNEEDILADQLRLHYALGVDAVIVTDNDSTDATPEILREFARDHELHIWHEPSNAYEQSEWVTRMARHAVQLGADWVINADADEFHWPEAGTLKDVFAAVPERYGVLELPVSHFVPTSDGPGAWHERLRLRECHSVKPSGGGYVRNVAHRAHPDVVVYKGNHRIGGVALEELPGWRPVTVLHFPIRSYEQYERKIAAGGEDYTGGRSIWVPGEMATGMSRILQEGRLGESYAAKRIEGAAAAEALRAAAWSWTIASGDFSPAVPVRRRRRPPAARSPTPTTHPRSPSCAWRARRRSISRNTTRCAPGWHGSSSRSRRLAARRRAEGAHRRAQTQQQRT